MSAKPLIKGEPGRVEFILLISVIMMTVAFAIDSMLPALPMMGRDLGVTDQNDRPIVITAFLIGFTAALLIAGIWSDAVGRRRPLLLGLAGYVISSLACTLANSFEILLVARVVQGMAAGAAQVVIRSVVRDKFAGRDMAQVMSLASMIFMAAPILAPAMGQLVLNFGSWRLIFGALACIGALVWLWTILRIRESLAPNARSAFSRANLFANGRAVLTDRMSLGYTLAIALLSSGLFGFLLSIEQIFDQTFGRRDFLPTGFAVMALGMAAASLANAAMVKRFGMRLIGHWALIGFVAVAGVHLTISVFGEQSLALFLSLQTLMMFCHALCMGNFNAMAMENMGHAAGMANSLQGTFSNLIGLVLGTIIGQSFDGTTMPFYLGCFTCGLTALMAVYVTEGGQLFVARAASKDEE